MPLYNADLKPLATGESTHDYDHAIRLFLSDNYRLAPKQSFLYYVCININQDFLSGIFGTGISSQGLSDQYEVGMLVKSVDLPKFSMDTKVMNAYNRKAVVQNKINYDPVSLTFHDDAANVVLNFWNDYYTYYYRDSDYESALYRAPSTYDLRQRTKWGFSPRNSNLIPFLRDIQIFSLNQKRFTEYKLINPMISSWKHGDHRSEEGNGIMECSMTLQYETVKYRTGYVNPTDVNGFSLLHYDTEPSPISSSTTNIYTDQGVVGVLGGGAIDLARPDGAYSGTNLISNYLSVQRAYQNLKSVNWGSVAQKTLSQIGVNIISGAINGSASGVVIPYSTSYGNGTYGITAQNIVNLSGLPNGSTVAGAGNAVVNSIYGAANSATAGVVQSANNAIGTVLGGITGLVNTVVAIPVNVANQLLTTAANNTFNYITQELVNPFTKQLETWLYQSSTGISNWFTGLSAQSELNKFDVSDIRIFEEQGYGLYTATDAAGKSVEVYYDLDINRFDTSLTNKQIYD